jgi:dihydrofolate reductase
VPEDRKLVVTENISANGVIEFVDDWFDPTDESEDQLEAVLAQSAAEDALLLGRQTFEDFRGYWPKQTDDRTGITAQLNQVSKYVYSTTLGDPEWENSTVVSGDLTELVRSLKDLPARPDGTVGVIGVTGSVRLVHALLAADLVDEIRLYVYPVITGNGRNLVPEGSALQRFRLTGSRTFSAGTMLLSYTRAD